MMRHKQLRGHDVVREGDQVCGTEATQYRHDTARPVPADWVGAEASCFARYVYRRRAILVLGHGSHGKGALCKLLTQLYGAECLSSSIAALPHIWPALEAASRYDFDGAPYRSAEGAYAKRADHRELWCELISLYNTPDKSTLAREVLSRADVYDGMRCAKEFEASRHLFDYVVWVDASARVPTVDPTLTISRDVADLVIDNNGTLDDLRGAAVRLGERLGVA
jgi:dephospho-CoA kinase